MDKKEHITKLETQRQVEIADLDAKIKGKQAELANIKKIKQNVLERDLKIEKTNNDIKTLETKKEEVHQAYDKEIENLK